MRSTLHCSCGHVRQTALKSPDGLPPAALRNNIPVISTRRLAAVAVAGAMASVVKVTGCHGTCTASTGIRIGRASGKYPWRGVDGLGPHSPAEGGECEPKSQKGSPKYLHPTGTRQREAVPCALRGAATTSIRVGCEPAGN